MAGPVHENMRVSRQIKKRCGKCVCVLLTDWLAGWLTDLTSWLAGWLTKGTRWLELLSVYDSYCQIIDTCHWKVPVCRILRKELVGFLCQLLKSKKYKSMGGYSLTFVCYVCCWAGSSRYSPKVYYFFIRLLFMILFIFFLLFLFFFF